MANVPRLWIFMIFWKRKIVFVVSFCLMVLLGYSVMAMLYSPYYVTSKVMVKSDVLADRAQELQAAKTKVLQEVEASGGLQQLDHHPVAPLVVLVLSSMPRSGSTLLSELLSSVQNSVLFFEPLWPVEKETDCYWDEACVAQRLADVFSCSYKAEFEKWLKEKILFLRYFSPEVRQCLDIKIPERKQKCLNDMSLRAMCEAAPVIFVKVIRARLSWIHNLLEDSLINLKVIHLTRDPRGSLNSIARFRWDARPQSRCRDLEDDLIAYDKLREVFPDKVRQVHYEHLCLRPIETTKMLFNFIFGNDTLPRPIVDYLTSHMLSGKYGSRSNMDTFKNSTREYESWRSKISDNYLRNIEKEPTCRRSIERMGFAFFGSQKGARNLTLPLILNGT